MSRPVLLALALAACKGGPDEGGTLERLVSQVLEPSGITEDEVVVHEVGHLTPGTELVPAFGEGPDAPAAVEVPAPTTLYLVDQNAGAGWTHDVDWVFLDDDGEARLETLESYPVVDGEGFVPEREPSVWGAPWEPVDPEDFDEDDELGVWDGATGAPRAASAVDPCDPPKPKVVITIAGGTFQAVRHDEANWRRLLGDRGYQTISVVPQGRRAPTRAQILDAIAQAVAIGELDELVIVYSGHGLRDGGAWGLGDTLETITGVVTAGDLIRALRGAKVDRLTIVSMSCHSGMLSGLPAALKAAGLTATDIVLQAASGRQELAWIPKDNSGTAFGKALFDLVAATPPGEDVPWDGIEVGPLVTTSSVGVRKQTAGVTLQARCEPEIGLATYPLLGTCYAAWLDMLDTAQFDPTRDYGREVMVRGRGFGEATGSLELQQDDGDWVRVPHRFWGPEGVAFNLPMRRDGFPSTGVAPAIPGVLSAPADKRGLPGTYLVRVVTAEGRASPPQPVHVVAQEYDQVWVPEVFPGDFPDWVEQWHPFTPEALWTLGPTVQVSLTYDGGLPVPVVPFAFDQDQPHGSILPPIGAWNYELGPGVRGPEAYDQTGPEFRYWGYRARFPDDDVVPVPWGFLLIYD